MKRIILIFFTFQMFISCRQVSPLIENEKAKIIEDVRMTLESYYNDIRKSGLTAEYKYLDNSTDFFWVPPGYSNSISYDSVIKILTENAPKYKSIDNTFDTLRIIPLTNEIATYTGRLHSLMTDTSDKTMIFSLVETGIIIKRHNGWKLLSGQTSILNQQ